MIYLYAVIALILGVTLLDYFCRTALYRFKKFWLLQLSIAIMAIAFDSWCNGRVWVINESFTSGIHIIHTQVETIIFGFALIYLNLVLFERNNPPDSHKTPNNYSLL